MQTIILDCDGVLLNWRDTYLEWLRKHGFLDRDWEGEYDLSKIIKMPGHDICTPEFARRLSLLFNESYLLRKLPPLPGAVDTVRKLWEAGHPLKVVSSYTEDYESMRSREANLINVFGNIFEEIKSLPLHAKKGEWLSTQAKDSIFIEDSVGNIQDAISVGIKPENCYLIPQQYNVQDYIDYFHHDSPVTRVAWRGIRELLLGR